MNILRTNFLLLLILAGCWNTVAQTIQTDSLKKVIEATEIDSIKTNALVELSNHYLSDDPDMAMQLVVQAFDIAEQAGDKRLISSLYGNIAEIYMRKGKYDIAEENLLAGLKIAEDIGSLDILQTTMKSLSEVYEMSGQHEKSYLYYIDFANIKDSLFSEDKSKELGKLEAKFEFEKAEEEKKRAEEERIVALAAAESRRNNLQYSGILIFLVALVGGILMLGKLSIPLRLAEGLIFFTFLLFFEFSLVLLDPYIEGFSGGEPAYKLLFNALLAAMIFPLHSFFEEKIKMRLLSSEDKP